MHGDPLTPGARIGAYDVQRVIASGAQGAVVEAQHRELGTRVALKIMFPSANAQAVARFRQEAQVLSRLQHTNLPRVTDLGDVDGRPFMALELIDGVDLAQLAKDESEPVSPERAVRILAPVARALDYCHSHGVVHRDVKPQNVVLERGTERAVLVDFGLLKRDEQVGRLSLDEAPVSLTGDPKGTPAYMAPEQADRVFGEVGPLSDVYGLGATLYTLLAGSPPYRGATAVNILAKLLSTDAPPNVSRARANLPPALADLCTSALSKTPDGRPASAGVMAADLEAALDGKRRGRKSSWVWAAMLAGVAIGAIVGFLGRGAAPPSPVPIPLAGDDSSAPAQDRTKELEAVLNALHEPKPVLRFLSLLDLDAPRDPRAEAELKRLQPWERLDSAERIPSRAYPGMCYDPHLQRLIVFSGSSVVGAALADGWTRDASGWQLLKSGDRPWPHPRTKTTLVYDERSEAALLFGGATQSSHGELYGDTWLLRGDRWEEITQPGGPSKRCHQAMAYDSERRVTVLFGGVGHGRGHPNDALGDTWEWNGRWRPVDCEGPTPPPRWRAAVAFDPVRNTTVLFGGWANRESINDTWTFDGERWTEHLGGPRPPAAYATTAWDPNRERIVLVSGRAFEHWEWDGARWARSAPLVQPDGAHAMRLVFDEAREELTLLGGVRGKTPIPGLWGLPRVRPLPLAVRSWLILEPAAIEKNGRASADEKNEPRVYADETASARALEEPLLASERDRGFRLDPRPGYVMEVRGVPWTWREEQFPDAVVEFAPRWEHAIGYAVGTVYSPSAQRCRFHIWADNAARVWVNGTFVHDELAGAPTFRAVMNAGPEVQLRAGANQVIVKLLNAVEPWKFKLCFEPLD